MPKGRLSAVRIGIPMLLACLAMPAIADPATGPLFYDQRRLPDMEVERRNQDVLAEQRRADEERQREAEAAVRAQAEASKQAEAERRLAAEAEAKRKADEEKRVAVEAEAKRKADEEKRIAAEAEAKRKADEEQRVAAEAEAKRKADEETRLAAAAAEAKRKAEDEKRRSIEVAEASRLATEAAEAKRKAAEAPAAAPTAPARVAANIQPASPSPAATSVACSAAKIDVTSVPGGAAQIGVDSACRHGQIIVVHYGAYDLTRKLGPNGQLVFALDMFLGNGADLSVGFADGSAQTVALPAADLTNVSKVALIWQAPVDLDLHAIESGGSFGKAGHRWQGAASSLEAARAESAETGRGAGYISTFDTGSRDGTKIEVYTFIHSPEQDNGAVSFLVDYASRGAGPSGDKCGAGALAEIPFDVVILDRKGHSSTESGIVPSTPCGAPLTTNARYLKGAVSDLRFRN